MKVAGAPITWGVCEVPGWGHQMSPERVLAEMAGLGLRATERGPDGFLPADPARLRACLAAHDLALVAGFIPAVLHRARGWDVRRAEVERQVDTLADGGAEMVVLAASPGGDGYEGARVLRDDEWRQLVTAIAEIEDIANRRGLQVSLHPHYGTVVEQPPEVDRLLETSPVGLCLDTGHIAVGGGDPVALAERAADRITHVHLKDVDLAVAATVRDGGVTYHEAVASGLYRVLGEGDVDVQSVIAALDQANYAGWFVLEQDTVLHAEPAAGAGPLADAGASHRFLQQQLPVA